MGEVRHFPLTMENRSSRPPPGCLYRCARCRGSRWRHRRFPEGSGWRPPRSKAEECPTLENRLCSAFLEGIFCDGSPRSCCWMSSRLGAFFCLMSHACQAAAAATAALRLPAACNLCCKHLPIAPDLSHSSWAEENAAKDKTNSLPTPLRRRPPLMQSL